jgi:hypothetical protein
MLRRSRTARSTTLRAAGVLPALAFAAWISAAPGADRNDAPSAGLGNLIPNGDFATSLDGWTCNGACTWIAQGSNGSIGAIDVPGSGASIITSSCFSVQPQTVYDVSFDAWANIGLAGGEFDLFCRAYADAGCTQPTGNFSYLPLYYFGSGSWNGMQGPHVTNANEFSARCEVVFSANGSETRMDSFVFTFNHPLDGIYANGFEGPP